MLPDRPDVKNLNRALEKMDSLGLKTGAATPQDAELLYLHKQAYLSKADREPDYQQLITELDRRAAGKQERIQTMRGFWEQRLGVKDLTRMPGYKPLGAHQSAFKIPGKTAGYRRQYRFDLSDQDLEKQMKGYGLYHSVTGDQDLPSLIDTVLTNNGAMVSTIEKMRIGIPVRGMSPVEDMDTGGSSYVFTRIRKLPNAGAAHATPGSISKSASCGVRTPSATTMTPTARCATTTCRNIAGARRRSGSSSPGGTATRPSSSIPSCCSTTSR